MKLSISSNKLWPKLLAAVVMTVVFGWHAPDAGAAEKRNSVDIHKSPFDGSSTTTASTSTTTLLQMPASITLAAIGNQTQSAAPTSSPPAEPQPIAFNFQLPKVIQQAQTGITQSIQSLPLLSDWRSATNGSPYVFKSLDPATTFKFNLAAAALAVIGSTLVFGKSDRKKYPAGWRKKLNLLAHEH